MIGPTVLYRSLIIVGVLVALDACKHGKCEDGGSSSAGRHSHNAGRDCMGCHLPDGEGEGCWTVAGSLYSPGGQHAPAGTRTLLFTRPLGQGDVAIELGSDQSGTIYTSNSLDFGLGLFPAVIGAAGDTVFMDESIRDGACNRCHGSSTDRVTLP